MADDETRDGPVEPLDPFRMGAMFGPYCMGGYIDEGGMGVIHRAVRDGATVVLKVPRVSAHTARLVREGEAGRLVNHPNVCRVLDAGVVGGYHFVCLEHIAGETLAARLRRDGPLLAAEAVRLVRLVAGGMQAAHDAGVIHRDLKPSNVMVGADGQPKVIDFGVARVPNAPRLTLPDRFIGTPAYMAYEQFDRDAEVDGRADVYALGVVLYELLVGEPPYRGEQLEVVNQILDRPVPPPPSDRRAGLDLRLDRVVLAALAHDRDRRWASMTAFADALAWADDPTRPEPAFPGPVRHPAIDHARRLADRIARRGGEGAG